MNKYTTPEIEIIAIDCDIVTFSVGSLDDMPGADGSPIRNAGGGMWSW